MDAKTMIPFFHDFESKGYKLIYRNGERPEDYKVWKDGRVTTIDKEGHFLIHDKNGYFLEDSNISIYDLFLTPPEMYIAVNNELRRASNIIVNDPEQVNGYLSTGYKLYRLVPVE